MKVSVIMIDGAFRENIYGAEYFTQQDFPENEYEVIWVEFYEKAMPSLYANKQLKIVTLGNPEEMIYHSSYCFNEGIKQAKGELLIIPDADVIVKPNFVQKAWDIHQEYEKMAVYGYRCNETQQVPLCSLEFDELEKKCVITNPINYGGCLTVRKKWLLSINGYDQHEFFETGFHANGLDVYTRFRNFGLAIKWDLSLKLYHPRHTFTSEKAPEYQKQRKLIEWRSGNLEYLTLEGIDSELNTRTVFPEVSGKAKTLGKEETIPCSEPIVEKNNFIQKIKRRLQP